MMTIRHATPADTDGQLEMFDHSRRMMRQSGNTTQWVGYPTAAQLEADRARSVSMLIEDAKGRPVGTFALVPGDEPTYAVIEHGRWIDTKTPYATVHRLAKMPGHRQIASAAFHYAKQQYAHLRADTHESNKALQHILEMEGFVECGIVYMNDGTERLAYEWWRWDEVDPSLQAYVERRIMPLYDSFDAAHQRTHARRVIARAMMMCRGTDALRPDVVYAAAAMHDIGLVAGREEHHLVSGRMIRRRHALRRWFSDAEIEAIAKSAEDHRASAKATPRSWLGCIIAEADRDVEPETIVRRTVEYGISHYPTLDREGHWQRTLEHLDEKYSEKGYIQLWMPDSPNAAPLRELRELIGDHERLRHLFDTIFDKTSIR